MDNGLGADRPYLELVFVGRIMADVVPGVGHCVLSTLSWLTSRGKEQKKRDS